MRDFGLDGLLLVLRVQVGMLLGGFGALEREPDASG